MIYYPDRLKTFKTTLCGALGIPDDGVAACRFAKSLIDVIHGETYGTSQLQLGGWPVEVFKSHTHPLEMTLHTDCFVICAMIYTKRPPEAGEYIFTIFFKFEG